MLRAIAPDIGAASGDVQGPSPASSTDNAVVRWDGATGRLIQNSAVTMADTTGQMTFPAGAPSSILAAEGAVGTPSYSFVGDPNTGMYSSGADALGFATGGTIKVQLGSGLTITAAGLLAWGSSGVTSTDLFLGRLTTASVRFGSVDAAVAVAQTMGVQNVVGGTTDVAGANWTINGSRGTGTGVGGSIIFQTALAGSTASTQNALVARLTVGQLNVTVSPATATPAGGSTAARLLFGTTAGFGIYYGSGAPSSLTAAQGSLYLRSDGSGIADRLYVNTTGSTTWTNFVSAA